MISIVIAAASGYSRPLSTHRIIAPLNSAATRLPSALPGLSSVSTILSADAAVRWSILGGILLQAGLSRLSIPALRRAVADRSDDLTLRAALGEALVLSGDGRVTDAAKQEFEFVLATDPNDLIARYYMAHWSLQNGRPKPALVKLVGLVRTVGNDPLWFADLWQVLPQAAEQVGVDRLALEALCAAGM